MFGKKTDKWRKFITHSFWKFSIDEEKASEFPHFHIWGKCRKLFSIRDMENVPKKPLLFPFFSICNDKSATNRFFPFIFIYFEKTIICKKKMKTFNYLFSSFNKTISKIISFLVFFFLLKVYNLSRTLV